VTWGRCDERVADNVGRVALQRGPIVYCVEGCDAAVLRGSGFMAIPCSLWANWGPGAMAVWLSDGHHRAGAWSRRRPGISS